MTTDSKDWLYLYKCPLPCGANLYYSKETIPEKCPNCSLRLPSIEDWRYTSNESKYDMWFLNGVQTTVSRQQFQRGIPLSESTRPRDHVTLSDINKVMREYYEKELEMEPVVPTRQKILQQALEIVTKDRNQDYGNPEDNFKVIAALWNVYLAARGATVRVDAKDVAAMMILMKMSRVVTSPNKEDHWVDIAGYSACGAECSGSSR